MKIAPLAFILILTLSAQAFQATYQGKTLDQYAALIEDLDLKTRHAALDAIPNFKAAALPILPRLIAILERPFRAPELRGPGDLSDGFDEAAQQLSLNIRITKIIAAIGPAAKDARPALEKWLAAKKIVIPPPNVVKTLPPIYSQAVAELIGADVDAKYEAEAALKAIGQ